MITLRKLLEDARGIIDLNIVLMIGIAFAALMVIAYIIWELRDQLVGTTQPTGGTSAQWILWNTTRNVTTGFDNAVNLLLVAITIFILAIAIGALLMLRGR